MVTENNLNQSQMTIKELTNKIFDYSFNRESLSKLLSDNVYTIDEIKEYINGVNTNKIFIEHEFKSWVKVKRKIKK